MIKPSTNLADVEHGNSHMAPPIVMRLRAAGVLTVEHFMRASVESLGLACPSPDDRVALRRWRGRIRKQLTAQQGI